MSKKTLTSNLAKWSLPLDWGHLREKEKKGKPVEFSTLNCT